jgi:hypothetical protein
MLSHPSDKNKDVARMGHPHPRGSGLVIPGPKIGILRQPQDRLWSTQLF